MCATASIRQAVCPIEELGVSSLTFTRSDISHGAEVFYKLRAEYFSPFDKTFFYPIFPLRQGSFTLDKEGIEDGFILVLTVLPDDGRCRSNDNEPSSVKRDKTVTVRTRSPNRTAWLVFNSLQKIIMRSSVLFGSKKGVFGSTPLSRDELVKSCF